MRVSRRAFLAGTASLFISSTVDQAYSQNLNNNKLVVIILRGNGRSRCGSIHRKRHFNSVTTGYLYSKSNQISGNFGLHPKLENFYNLWKSNNAKIVHATSIPYTERSHFEGQNLLESGGSPIPAQNWLVRSRALETTMGHGCLYRPMPLLLRGITILIIFTLKKAFADRQHSKNSSSGLSQRPKTQR